MTFNLASLLMKSRFGRQEHLLLERAWKQDLGPLTSPSLFKACVSSQYVNHPFDPCDIVFSDPKEGCVVIPRDKVDAVLEMAPKAIKADEKVKEEVEKGMSVKEAFTKFRINL